MKKWMIASFLFLSFNFQPWAQEFMLDSVNRANFTGVHQSGEMGQFIYIPYFTTDKTAKRNFIIRQLNGQTFTEEQVLRFELPPTYILKASAFNGSAYLLHFYDEAKKEDILISTTGDNINKKKNLKSSGETYFMFSGMTPEDFILIAAGNKGDYKVQKIGIDLESIWEKKFTAPSGIKRQIVGISNKMGNLEIIRKDNRPGNKYEFSMHYIQLDSGEDIAQVPLTKDNTQLYPTFFAEKEGMNFIGGYYYADGIYNGKPLGLFLALTTPDGNIERITKVPYSLVIEDLKSTVGAGLSKENTTIIFTDGIMSHETQSFVLAGQVITRQNNENNTTISFDDFIAVKFSMEQEEYKGAVSTPYKNSQITINDLPATVNTLDLSMWMNHTSLIPFSHFLNMHGAPVMAYRTIEEGGLSNLCFRPLGVKNDTTKPECTMLYREPQKTEPYKYTGNLVTKPVSSQAIIPSAHDIGNIGTYALNNNILLISKTPLPRLDRLMRPVMPEHEEPHEHHEETQEPESSQ